LDGFVGRAVPRWPGGRGPPKLPWLFGGRSPPKLPWLPGGRGLPKQIWEGHGRQASEAQPCQQSHPSLSSSTQAGWPLKAI